MTSETANTAEAARMRVLIPVALLVAACHPKSDNIPLEEAADAPLTSAVARTTLPQPHPVQGVRTPVSFEADGELWLATGGQHRLEAGALQLVAGAGGRGLYVLKWDEPPYDRMLLARDGGVYVEYQRLLGGPALAGGAPAPAGAITDSAALHGASGAPARTQATEH